MEFLGHLLTSAVQYVLTIAISGIGGIYVGKMLRDRKTAKKQAAE